MSAQTDGESFVKLPASLITQLSDTALRIILYAIDREGLVKTGRLKKWELSLADVENQFSEKFKGYSRNTVRNGFKELGALGLLDFKGTHYRLNNAMLKKWLLTHRKYEGVPKSGRGRMPKSGSDAVPNFGRQEKSSKKKKSTREEQSVPKAVPIVKTPLESFDEIIGGTNPVRKKTPVEQFDEMFSEDTAGEAPSNGRKEGK